MSKPDQSLRALDQDLVGFMRFNPVAHYRLQVNMAGVAAEGRLIDIALPWALGNCAWQSLLGEPTHSTPRAQHQHIN